MEYVMDLCRLGPCQANHKISTLRSPELENLLWYQEIKCRN